MIHFENGVKMPLSFPPVSLDEFAEFCRRNPNLQAERTSDGELTVMAPAESYGDSRNTEITAELVIWNRRSGQPGIVFGQSAGFTLPDSAVRSPDAAWISIDRWQGLSPDERAGFARICPDFVLELLSPFDRHKDAQAKMAEYIANGAKLGWLINRRTRIVEVYRQDQPVQSFIDPVEMRADPELPGFVLPMHLVFD